LVTVLLVSNRKSAAFASGEGDDGTLLHDYCVAQVQLLSMRLVGNDDRCDSVRFGISEMTRAMTLQVRSNNYFLSRRVKIFQFVVFGFHFLNSIREITLKVRVLVNAMFFPSKVHNFHA
jgi:hypothetical protein